MVPQMISTILTRAELRSVISQINIALGKLASTGCIKIDEMAKLEAEIDRLRAAGETSLYASYRTSFSLIFDGK